MEQSPLRVVIAGGGVAGLEVLMALYSLAGDRVALTLVAPEDQFVYRPLAVDGTFAVDRMREAPLRTAASHADATFVSDIIETANPERKRATTSAGEQLEYDALVLALGANTLPGLSNVLTWDDRSDADVLGGLLQDVEEGYTRRLAVVIPPGPGWPLRGYELALLVKLEASSMSVDIEMTIVSPDPPPLALLGERAVELVSKELEQAGIAVASAAHIDVVTANPLAIVLQPSGERIEVDRAIALPVLQGRAVRGVPATSDGFVEVDEHCRARGLDAVWAVGDCTAFPVKSGGFAAEQADVAAEDIAAAAGAPVEARTFDASLREDLAGLPAGRFLEEWLAADDPGLSTHLPASGVPVLTYLERDLAAGWRGGG
jgi:sulfide:quinone oxidoreductase